MHRVGETRRGAARLAHQSGAGSDGAPEEAPLSPQFQAQGTYDVQRQWQQRTRVPPAAAAAAIPTAASAARPPVHRPTSQIHSCPLCQRTDAQP